MTIHILPDVSNIDYENISVVEIFIMLHDANLRDVLMNTVVNVMDDDQWELLCKYEWALPLLEDNFNKLSSICWQILCTHQWTLSFITEHVDKLDDDCWDVLCEQEWALPLLEKYGKTIKKPELSKPLFLSETDHKPCLRPLKTDGNSKYLESLTDTKEGRVLILEEMKHNGVSVVPPNIDIMDDKCWDTLCGHEWAYPLLQKNACKLNSACWLKLCDQEWALGLLKANLNKLDNECIDKLTTQKWALQLLSTNANLSIPWKSLCKQEWALPLLKDNLDKLNNECCLELCNHKWAIDLLLMF